SFADSCGFVAATAPEVEFAIVQLPLLEGPTPRLSGLVVAGDTDVNVTATLPAVVTENVKIIELLGARAPLNVSLVDDDGVVGLPNRLLSGFVQADVASIDAGIRSDRNSRRTFILLLSARARARIRLDVNPNDSSGSRWHRGWF